MATAPPFLRVGDPAFARDDDSLEKFLSVATGRSPVPTPTGAVTPPEDGKIVALVNALRRQAEGEMTQYRIRWAMTDAMVSGSQWVGLNPRTNQVEPLPGIRSRPRLQINKMKGWLFRTVARLLSTHPQLVVKPGSSEDRIVNSARVTTKVIGEHEWQAQGMDGILSEFNTGFVSHGDGALEVEWNPKGGKYLGKVQKPMRDAQGNKVQALSQQIVTDPTTGQMSYKVTPAVDPSDGMSPIWEPERDDNGEPVMIDSWEGCTETSYIRSADIFSEPGVARPDDSMWWLVSVAKTPAYVFDRWNVEVQPDGTSRTAEQFRFNRMQRWNNITNTVMVDKLWIKKGTYRYGVGPNDVVTFAKGYVAVVCGNKLLDAGPNPYDHGEIPVIFERAYPQDGQMRGDTFMNDLRDVQVGYNKAKSIFAFGMEMHADPQWAIPNSCNVPTADKRNGPGTIWRYDTDPTGAKPERIEGTTPPNAVLTFAEGLNEDGADIAGQHEGGMAGGVPANIEAGVALEALVERDTTALSPIAMAIGRLLEKWAYLTAQNYKQFVSETRQIAVAGEWNTTEVHEFSGLDIHDSFQFTIVPQSVMPQSKAAEFQKNMVMYQAGLLGPVGSPQAAREFMKRTGEDMAEVMSLDQMQASNARTENYTATTTGAVNTPPELVMFDDPQIHGEEHMRALLDRDFAATNPQGWMALAQHYTNPPQAGGHGLPLPAMLAAMQMQAAMAPPPGPGGPTGPPQSGGAPGPGGAPPPPDPGDAAMSVPRPGISSPSGGPNS